MTWADCEAELAGLTERGTPVDDPDRRRTYSVDNWESNRDRVARDMREQRRRREKESSA